MLASARPLGRILRRHVHYLPPGRCKGETGTRRTRGKNGSDAATRLLEAQIAEAEAQLEVVKRQLLDPATFSDRAAAAHIGREHDRLTGALADLYDRWAAAIH